MGLHDGPTRLAYYASSLSRVSKQLITHLGAAQHDHDAGEADDPAAAVALVAAAAVPRASVLLPVSRGAPLCVPAAPALLRERDVHVRRVRLLHDVRQGGAAGVRGAEREQGELRQRAAVSEDVR